MTLITARRLLVPLSIAALGALGAIASHPVAAASGPQHTCIKQQEKLVYRLATIDPYDDVCINDFDEPVVQEENRTASQRWFPGTTECIPGYVHRLANDKDLVCVSQDRHDIVQRQNTEAASTWVPEPHPPTVVGVQLPPNPQPPYVCQQLPCL